MQMINVREVAQMLGCSKDTIWRRVRKEPGFPKPVKFSSKCTRWEKSEIEGLIKTKLEKRAN